MGLLGSGWLPETDMDTCLHPLLPHLLRSFLDVQSKIVSCTAGTTAGIIHLKWMSFGY
jgi:hypothetical protein